MAGKELVGYRIRNKLLRVDQRVQELKWLNSDGDDNVKAMRQ